MALFDIPAAFKKLANHESLTEDETVDLLKELEHFRGALSYLASCQAATLESLPKSSSKSQRGRHVHLCEAAAKMLEGDSSPIKYPERLHASRERCLRAAAEYGVAE